MTTVMKEPSAQTTPEDDPYNELLWGGDFDERQEAELDRRHRRDEIARITRDVAEGPLS